MLQKLRNNPLLSASLVVLIYALLFILPQFFITADPKQNGITGISQAIGLWKAELIVSILLIIIVSLLGWWKKIGFRSINPGGTKFLLAPLALILIIFGFAWTMNESANWYFGFESSTQLLTLFLVMLMVGFTEEGIFRGILFHGLESKFTPWMTLLLSAVLFGLFHYVNLLVGAKFYVTSYQVVHAGAMGFLYAALRLRIGAIWPLMILHGLWDASLFILHDVNMTNTTQKVEEATSFSPLLAIILALPAATYGLFVYWRWYKWSHRPITSSSA